MKLKYIIPSVVAALSLSACGDMDYHEYKVDGEDFVKETFGNVYGLISPVYKNIDYDFGQLYSGASLCSATDEAVYSHIGNSVENFYNGGWSSTTPQALNWSSAWRSISDCNLILDKFQGLTFDDYRLDINYQAQMAKYLNYKWEARFLRAYFYFLLVRQYGDVPMKLTDMTAEEANALPRVPAEEIFKFIDDECKEIQDSIIKDYSTSYPEVGNENGRANHLVVMALRARAALYHASPLFNKDNDKELWHKAALAAQACIDSCKKQGMTLAKDYSKLFKTDNYKDADAVKEIIFARRLAPASNNFEKYNYPIGMENAGGGNCPTQNLVDAYETTNGMLITDTNNDMYDPQNPYANRDARLGFTVAVNGENFPDDLGSAQSTPLETFIGGANSRSITYGTPTGYYLKKYINRDTKIGATGATSAFHTWIIFRMGGLYLDYAEAMLNYMGNGYTKESGLTLTAADAINLVRKRAGQPNLPEGLSADQFRSRYENERFVELAFEGHRFFDVRRWKKGPEYFKDIKVMEITKNADNSFSYKTVTNPNYITSRQWDDKMYLFPIPQADILKSNGALTQTPGW